MGTVKIIKPERKKLSASIAMATCIPHNPIIIPATPVPISSLKRNIDDCNAIASLKFSFFTINGVNALFAGIRNASAVDNKKVAMIIIHPSIR